MVNRGDVAGAVVDPVTRCALGEVAWHGEAYAALRVPWRTEPGLAWRVGDSHRFLLSGIVTTTDTPAARVVEAVAAAAGSVVVRDAHGLLDLSGDGYAEGPADPWMLRPPGRFEPGDAGALAGVTIRRAVTPHDVMTFERTAFVANDDIDGWEPGAIHPSDTTLDRSDLHLFLAEVDGDPVGTALASVCPTGVTVSGVSTVSHHRRRGIGAALTRAAVETAPDRQATLTASIAGAGVYRRLGFEVVGQPRRWTRR